MTQELRTTLGEIQEHYRRLSIEHDWDGERPSLSAAIPAIIACLGAHFRVDGVLGVGGSGVVLRIADARFPGIRRALKFPRPIPGKVDFVAQMLEKEIHHLAAIRHPGIVTILDYGKTGPVGTYSSVPFYLMDVVEGLSSRRFVKNATTANQIITVIAGAAEVLEYLHSDTQDGYVHLDLKPDNFVVAKSGQPVMIDLGTCKRISDSSQGDTSVACTRSFAHPELVRSLSVDPSDDNRARGRLSRAEIKKAWDLWAFGLTIVSWLGIDHQTGKQEYPAVLGVLDAYSRKYLFLLAARLLTGPSAPSWLSRRVGLSGDFLAGIPIESAAQLVELLNRLSGKANPILRVPEMATAQTDTIQAAPGVHVPVTRALKAVLAHKYFRRLNTISQLGLVSQVYPGAKHSRREHSLGTYANVSRMIRALYDDGASPLFRQLVSEEGLRAVLLAALLHDLGQFPMAHDFEEIDRETFDHVELTEAMIKGSWEKKKKGSRKIKFDTLSPIFSAWGLSAERVLAILHAKSTSLEARPEDKLLRSLISGPVDADKLDYLLRDARHLDVPYPLGVDIERLYVCLTTVVVERVERGAENVPGVGVQAKGKVAAEFLSLARYAMFSQAYWHHAVRAQKAMLFRAVEALLAVARPEFRLREFQSDFIRMAVELPELRSINYNSRLPLFPTLDARAESDVSFTYPTDLCATDAAVLLWIKDRLAALKRPEGELLDSILTRRFFKRLWVVSRDREPEIWQKLIEKWSRFGRQERHRLAGSFERRIAKKFEVESLRDVTELRGEAAAERISQMTRGEQPWLLVDIPGDRPGSEMPLYYVLENQRRALRKDDRAVGDLQISKIWHEYARGLVSAAGKVRIFCHPGLVDSVEASIEWRRGLEDLLAAMDEAAD